MLKRRRGSVFAFAISLTAVFLTMIVATMAYFEASNKQAAGAKWREVAEQASRSGLDFVLGWGEATIDRYTRVPTSWEMEDGQAVDPIAAFGSSGGVALVTHTNPQDAVGAGGAAGPAGRVLGPLTQEYIIGRVGNNLITFKARLQQFRMSEDAPRQYRIAVAGRVRKINDRAIDGREKDDIVAERLLVATFGKEPFSRYAALIDVDAVKNWVPGEEVEGPVHINRGYLDSLGDRNLKFTTVGSGNTFDLERSFMKLHSAGGPGGFQAVGPATKRSRNHPVFLERVSMTVYSDQSGTVDGPKSDDETTTLSSAITVDGAAPSVAAAQALMNTMFTHPDNAGAVNGVNGPIKVNDPIPFPPNSRQRLNTALGCPPGTVPAQLAWLPALDDGLYVPTVQWVAGAGIAQTTAALRYNTGLAYPAGGIYLRGNVEVMRMSVDGPFSYYFFQMGYGGYRSTLHGTVASVRRVYMVRVNRVTRALSVRAFPRFIPAAYGAGGVIDSYTTPDVMRELLQAGGNNPARYFTNAALRGNNSVMPADYRVVEPNQNVITDFTPVDIGYSEFPFNGVIFVDASRRDPLNLTPVAGVPITGNIYALGDPGTYSPLNPANKLNLFTRPEERVATNATAVPGAYGKASKLTIVTAGHMFIQNDIMLEALRTHPQTAGGRDPKMDDFGLPDSRDLIGLVADRQVVFGLAAPDLTGAANRNRAGCVVHAAIAALQDPNTTPLFRTGVPAYWGSFATEGLQPLFNGGQVENYRVVNVGGGGLPDPFTAAHIFNPLAIGGLATEGGMPGNPYFVSYNPTKALNPNRASRGRLLVFGSVTQRKRGAIGAGNNGFDKDFRYDKRLMSIAPPVFPTSTKVTLRVSSISSPGSQPYNGVLPAPNPDLNFMAVNGGEPQDLP